MESKEKKAIEPEVKKALYLMLVLPVVYVGMVLVLLYSMENGQPVLAAAYTAAGMLAVALVMRNFLSKTLFVGKREYTPFRTVDLVGPGAEEGARDVRVTVSGYTGRVRFKLFVDDAEAADAMAGERVRLSLPRGKQMVAARDVGGVGSEIAIKEDGALDLYVWLNRRAKAGSIIRVDDVTGGFGRAEEEDAAVYESSKRLVYLPLMLTPVISPAIMAIVVML
ncbi:MAG: hypothetical protein FWH47_07705 [Methanomassiliicoccaceae archaeon]|nr:hypothetical protein [Methanomassiliicoccaceae archaeon]